MPKKVVIFISGNLCVVVVVMVVVVVGGGVWALPQKIVYKYIYPKMDSTAVLEAIVGMVGWYVS